MTSGCEAGRSRVDLIMAFFSLTPRSSNTDTRSLLPALVNAGAERPALYEPAPAKKLIFQLVSALVMCF